MLKATYEHYAIGAPAKERPAATTEAELQAQISGFLAKHPMPPMSQQDQADMNWRYEQVMRRLQPGNK